MRNENTRREHSDHRASRFSGETDGCGVDVTRSEEGGPASALSETSAGDSLVEGCDVTLDPGSSTGGVWAGSFFS